MRSSYNMKILFCSLSLIIALVFPGVVFGTQPKATVRIGVLLDLSGPSKDEGKLCYESLQRHVHLINSSAGPNRWHLELMVFDTKGNDMELRIGASRLADSGIMALIGPGNPENVITLRRFCETYKIPLILIQGVSPILTYSNIKTKWTFSTTVPLDIEIKSLFSALKKRGYESLSVLIQASNNYKEMAMWIKGYAPEYRLRIGCFEAFYLNAEDIAYKTKYISNCMSDACLLWANHNAINFIGAIDNIQVPMAMSHQLLSRKTVSEDYLGLIFVAIPAIIARNFLSNIQLTMAMSKFFSAWPFDDFYNLDLHSQFAVIHAWDALGILSIALNHINIPSHEAIRDALETSISDYSGLSGSITFDKKNHSGIAQSSLMVLSKFGRRWTIEK